MVYEKADLVQIAKKIIDSGAVDVRNVDAGEKPFVYSSGNRGPGYVMIKGLVGQPEVLKFLVRELAHKVVEQAKFDFIEGNATGGMVPAWQLRNDISEIVGREIPYCYLRGSRKEGGHGELITGNGNNPLIKQGMSVLVVEELVNYAETTCNAAVEFRKAGYPVSHAACILNYNHEEAQTRLAAAKVNLVHLIALPELLEIAEAENWLPKAGINSYKQSLADPIEWQLSRGFVIPTKSAQTAIAKGRKMVKLSPADALAKGAPEDRLRIGDEYWEQQ